MNNLSQIAMTLAKLSAAELGELLTVHLPAARAALNAGLFRVRADPRVPNKIAAIKAVRSVLDIGLGEAKRGIEGSEPFPTMSYDAAERAVSIANMEYRRAFAGVDYDWATACVAAFDAGARPFSVEAVP